MPDPKKRGRPPLDPTQPSTRVDVLVTASDYDSAYRRAQRDGVSIPTLMRKGLRRVLEDDEHDT